MITTTIELLPFQVRASQQIVNRYLKLQADPKRPAEHKGWDVPYYQALSALVNAVRIFLKIAD